MYAQEKITPYNKKERKGKQVAHMFDRIAHSYDLLNHMLSLGFDKHWRNAAIKSLMPLKPQSILDVATGTGDFALLAANKLKPKRLLGVDISEGMLNIGQKKIKEKGLEEIIELKKDDCMQLNIPDNEFDAVMVAYGVRNFENLEKGLKEMQRVMKKGGQLVIIELTTPNRFPMKQLFFLYAHILMPLIGKLFSKDKKAYNYLPATMEAFPQGEVMQNILLQLGYSNVKFQRFTCGLNTLYTATKA